MRKKYELNCLLLVALALTISMLLGCRKDQRVEVFELPQVIDFTIDPGLNTFDTYFFPFSPIPSSFQSRLEDFNLEANEIISVEPKSGSLSSIFGDENLEFIERISLRLFKVQEPTFNREIFYFDPVPFKKATTLRPFPGLSNVKEIVENTFYGIELRLDFRFVPQRSIDMRFEFSLSARRD
jgi:hypothetical protein